MITPSQERAIRFGDGPALVLAGPGSGKTLVITHRIRFLTEEKQVPPNRILVVTFSRAAAEEMKERFSALCPGTRGVLFGTFHGVFFQILKQAYHYSGSSILREEERLALIGEAASASGFDLSEQREMLTALAAEISLVKNEQIAPEHYYSTSCADMLFREIFQRYHQAVREKGRIDFDDMLVQCYALLREREDILRHWQSCFRYILVDEFQDINRIQYEVLKLLLKPEQHLFAVGDDDQSIYRFRGACPEIMLGFTKDFPEAALLGLEENFRCSLPIVQAAGHVIVRNRRRYPKRIRAVSGEAGQPVVLRSFADVPKEAAYMVRCIREGLRAGRKAGEFAVLVRNNREGRYFAEVFLQNQIPFVMRDMGTGLYEHWICQDVLAYLRLASGQRSRRDFLRVMNRPLRYISRTVVDQERVSFDRLRYWYDEKPWMVRRLDEMEEDLHVMGAMRPYAAINYLRKSIGYDAFLKEYAKEKGIQEEELYSILEELQESASSSVCLREWMERITEWKEALQEKKSAAASLRGASRAKEEVTLSTLHGAKGLEFEEVFMPDLNETVLPSRKARLEADIEEERRLFYVGMTRAKRRLHLLYAKERFGRTMSPSRFLKDLSPKTVQGTSSSETMSSNSWLSSHSSKASEASSYSSSSRMLSSPGSPFSSRNR